MSQKIDWARAAAIWEALPNILAVWVFGSAQTGEVRPGGDVDIGILFDSPPELDEQLDLEIKLQKAIQVAELDVVVLNNANVILRFEVVSGRPLFCRDIDRRAEFVSLTAREYEDEMAMWQRALANRSRSAAAQ